jgi:hypothetical protein
MIWLRSVFLVMVWHLMFSAAAIAQDSTDPWRYAKFHVGPVALAPTISLANLGVDTNVFAAQENPQRDWTFTFVPATRAIVRMGNARLTGQVAVLYQYFNKFTSERSLNTRGSAQLDVPLNRVRLTAGSSTQNDRQRSGSEITARVRRYESKFNAGANVRVGGHVTLGVAGTRTQYTFPQREQFLGTNLRKGLERNEDTASLILTRELTPLTTFRLIGEAQHDVFLLSPERNATSVRVMLGFETSPQTLLKGSAFVGVQKYNPASATVPAFQGVVAATNLTYVLHRTTQLNARVDRNLSYSYDVRQPYFVFTSVNGEMTQHLFGHVDALAAGGRQRLDYRSLEGATEALASRRDWSSTYGAALAYGFGKTGRVRVSLNGTSRHSALAVRNYQTRQMTTSVDYGF